MQRSYFRLQGISIVPLGLNGFGGFALPSRSYLQPFPFGNGKNIEPYNEDNELTLKRDNISASKCSHPKIDDVRKLILCN